MSGIVNSTGAVSGIIGTTSAPAIGTGTDGYVFTGTGAGVDPAWEALAAAGITHASKWRLHTGIQGTHTPISASLEESDSTGYGRIGDIMEHSSGVFTFPATGYWYIAFVGEWYYNGDSRYMHAKISTTINTGSNWSEVSRSASFVQVTESGYTYTTAYCDFVFDVTNVSTHLVRFQLSTSNESVLVGASTDIDRTAMTFIRQGDT